MNFSLLNNKSILIVEDNTINQMLVKHAIAKFDANADIAETGTQALALMKNKNYDIILMDIFMPELDGYQTTEIIRNEMHLDIPLIAMTALALKGEEEKCLALGMNGYLSKPFTSDVLYNTLVKAIEQVENAA